MKKITKFKITFKTKKELWALLFIIPWVIGFLMFFFIPLIETFRLSLYANDGASFTYNGVGNYNFLFNEFNITINQSDYSFTRIIAESVKMIAIELPLITIFSLFIAVLLNQKFKGRGLVRTIFFLPIIFGTGIIVKLNTINSAGDYFGNIISSQPLYRNMDILYLFEAGGIPQGIVKTLNSFVNQVFSVVAYSGVQILIFLSALQSVSPTLYEVAKIEGANSYESFWKITLPSITPVIITAVVYTFVDILYRSPITTIINEVSTKTQITGGGFGIASAIAVIFLALTMVLLSIIIFILGRMNRSGKR